MHVHESMKDTSFTKTLAQISISQVELLFFDPLPRTDMTLLLVF